jgi:hypothetical protein
MSPKDEELGADKQVQSEDAKAPKSTKTVAALEGSKKKASISESSSQDASNLTQEAEQATAEQIQKTLEKMRSNPVPELEGEALEDYQTADDDEDETEKRQRIRAEREAKGLSPFIDEGLEDDDAARRSWKQKDASDMPAVKAAFAKIEEKRTVGTSRTRSVKSSPTRSSSQPNGPSGSQSRSARSTQSQPTDPGQGQPASPQRTPSQERKGRHRT